MTFPRLYAILDVDLLAARGLDALTVYDGWLDAGVRLVQLRAKTLAGGRWLDLADAMQVRAARAGSIFIVNDRADIATMSGAAGVHVGQDDLPPADVRRLLGPDALIGLSTHNEPQIRRALLEPIDYLAIGPVFETGSKDRPDPVVGVEGVALASRLAAETPRADGGILPVVAIGGITLERAPSVIGAGASSVAVISDLLVGHPGDRARAFLRVLQ